MLRIGDLVVNGETARLRPTSSTKPGANVRHIGRGGLCMIANVME